MVGGKCQHHRLRVAAQGNDGCCRNAGPESRRIGSITTVGVDAEFLGLTPRKKAEIAPGHHQRRRKQRRVRAPVASVCW